MTVKAEITIMSHLSDAEIEIEFNPEQAKLRINFAKFLILKCNGDLNQEINVDAYWEEFKLKNKIE